LGFAEKLKNQDGAENAGIESRIGQVRRVAGGLGWRGDDIELIRSRWERAEPFLDERGRRLLAANEALREGFGGVSATTKATGLARSTINRGIRELRSGRNEIGRRVRRAGAGRKSAVAHQPGLPAALETLIEDAIFATRHSRRASTASGPAAALILQLALRWGNGMRAGTSDW
jgi:hypothetical protein